jgi:hypothetical protein
MGAAAARRQAAIYFDLFLLSSPSARARRALINPVKFIDAGLHV